MPQESLIVRLRKRAEIRRSIKTRKSVQEGKPDRIADLLDEAADEIESLTPSNFKTYDTSHGACGLCGSNTCSGSCFK